MNKQIFKPDVKVEVFNAITYEWLEVFFWQLPHRSAIRIFYLDKTNGEYKRLVDKDGNSVWITDGSPYKDANGIWTVNTVY